MTRLKGKSPSLFCVIINHIFLYVHRLLVYKCVMFVHTYGYGIGNVYFEVHSWHYNLSISPQFTFCRTLRKLSQKMGKTFVCVSENVENRNKIHFHFVQCPNACETIYSEMFITEALHYTHVPCFSIVLSQIYRKIYFRL